MRYIKLLSFSALLASCMGSAGVDVEQKTAQLTDFVDPLIGSGGHGHVFVGANVPFGFVQLGPTSISEGWDWVSGYHISDSTVIGFSHTHLNGTGIGDLLDITVMPVTGHATYHRGDEKDTEKGYWSYADRSKQVAKPGYYAVPLTRYNILAEMTATPRVGVHRYTFPASQESAIIFDLQNGGNWDKATATSMQADGNQRIVGYRYSKGWANDQKIYFVAEFSKPFDSFETGGEENLFARASFKTADQEQVLLRVGVSPTSIEGAIKNLEAEVKDWDFDAIAANANALWNDQLDKIQIETADEAQKRTFYTAMYHTMIAPSLFNDVDGTYAGADGAVHAYDGFQNYTTFSLWDTYRAAHPLMTIVHPERMPDMMNTMLHIYDQQGKLPVWHLMGNETNCMVGNPGICVVADAVVKNIAGFDHEQAFQAIKNSAMKADRGQDLRMKYGYIPSNLFGESVAYELEYAVADGAAAQVAEKLGKEEDYAYFTHRSHSYRRHFDPETKFMRGVTTQEKFREPFNPVHSTHRADDYCEGNAWQYTWLAPHDVDGLVGVFGSRAAFVKKLDSLFLVSSALEGEASPDISGLIGQYAHGNEPSHHILYLYTMVGQPWKTAEKVREVLTTLYNDTPEGIAGNEDVGQMSAWYVLSSMGFYQVEPASNKYYFGSPLFDEVGIAVPNGKFEITANNNSKDNIYIQSITLNGQTLDKPYITYEQIMAGGKLEIEMGNEPKTWYNIDDPKEFISQRPDPEKRLFVSQAIEKEIDRVSAMLTNDRLRWMFQNCLPSTLDGTVHYREDENGIPDTYVYTGDIPAMWLRDSGAQVWPYVMFANQDPALQKMIAGTINRQFKLINIDPYANAFNDGPTGVRNPNDYLGQGPWVFERKWEIDSHCYPIRLAHHYWKTTGDESIFAQEWVAAMHNIVKTMKAQQRKEGHGDYTFLRITDRQLDTKNNVGRGNPVRPVGLIASSFRPSDDATTFEYLIPSNFMAVSALRKASEILTTVNQENELAQECTALANEVEAALKKYAVYNHPTHGEIYAFECDGFGNQLLMDDANVPSLLSMAYLGDVDRNDPIYENTRKFVWSEDNPYFFKGAAGEGIGGPHIGIGMIWPMSIMMKAFTSTDDEEIKHCIRQLMLTDAGTGFMHESFHQDDASNFTRPWFAWQNTLFGELILKLVSEGKVDLLNTI